MIRDKQAALPTVLQPISCENAHLTTQTYDQRLHSVADVWGFEQSPIRGNAKQAFVEIVGTWAGSLGRFMGRVVALN